MSKLLGLILIARNGDRLTLPQDPATYETNVVSSTTALGEYNSWKVGESIRRIYIGNARNENASFTDYDPSTVGFPPYDPQGNFDWHTQAEPAMLHDPRQIHVQSKAGVEGAVVFDSTIALLQGMYPPTPKNGVKLANGTWVQAPFGGYQYVPVETVEPNNDRSLESWTQCPAFKKHIDSVNKSDKMKKKNQEAGWFWSAIRDYTFGMPTGIENIWNVYDFMNTQMQYNQSYAYRLPNGLLSHARALADFHEDAVFGDNDPRSIANIAGRTLLPALLDSLQKIADLKNPLQISVVSTTYQPFISLFHMFNMKNSKSRKALTGIPDFASSLLLEVRQSPPPELRTMLRFAFANSSDSRWEPVTVLDETDDFVPLTEFIYRVQGSQVSGDLKDWKHVCSGKSGLTEVPEMGEWSSSIMAFIFLAVSVFALVRRYRTKKAAIRLHDDEGRQEKVVQTRSIPVYV